MVLYNNTPVVVNARGNLLIDFKKNIIHIV
jgi:hypothetical protein